MLVSQDYLDMALEIQKEVPSIKHILLIDEHAVKDDVTNIYDLPEKYDAKWRQRSSKSTAFIIYTSGTTGAPKGVEISFKNVNAQLVDLMEVVGIILPKNQKINMLSILPMNHLFEMTVGFSTFLNSGFSVFYTSSFKPKDITGVMKEKGIQFMIAVPAFLKLLKAGIEKELSASPIYVRLAFKVMYFIAQFIPSYKMRRKLFKKLHQNLGGKFFGCISGGAPLDVEVGEFFERIGIRVYQGYGLSETSPVVSVNYDKRGELASVGHPLSHFEAKVDEQTGELLLRGPSVMKGYHNHP
jgi:long-chain acyl-CoA synthetase